MNFRTPIPISKSNRLIDYNSNIVSFKFELRENAVLVEDATHLLSQGEGFYYRKENETTVHPILQNGTANSVAGVYPDGVEYNLYYGKPSGTLDTDVVVKKSIDLGEKVRTGSCK